MSKLVMDISKYNTVSSYAFIAQEVDGVIVRCGYRGLANGKLVEDPCFGKHITNLMKNGVKVGVYFFTTAINTNEAAEEAAFTVSLLKKYNVNVSFPIFIDTEMSNNSHTGRSDALSKSTRTDVVVTFCEKIQALGYIAGIYASDSWFVSQLNLSSLTKYKLWVAKYSTNSPVYVNDYVGWQYTSNGSIRGANGRVDLSHWYNEIGSTNNTVQNVDTLNNPYAIPTSTIRKGNKGEGVFWLQYELSKVGYTLAIDGEFGPKTYCALMDYQKTRGLIQDGILGSITRNALINKKEVVLISESTTTELKSGAGPFRIDNVKLYTNSKTPNHVKEISGDYYIWNENIVNNRIRICKSKSNANNLLGVVGWIDFEVISSIFK